MARVCAECGAVRGTYSNHCDACQHRRRQTQQQRNRRTGSHIPTAPLDSGDVRRLAEVHAALAQLTRRFENAQHRAEEKGATIGPLGRDAIRELSHAVAVLDGLLNGPLAESLTSMTSPAPRRYGRITLANPQNTSMREAKE